MCIQEYVMEEVARKWLLLKDFFCIFKIILRASLSRTTYSNFWPPLEIFFWILQMLSLQIWVKLLASDTGRNLCNLSLTLHCPCSYKPLAYKPHDLTFAMYLIIQGKMSVPGLWQAEFPRTLEFTIFVLLVQLTRELDSSFHNIIIHKYVEDFSPG